MQIQENVPLNQHSTMQLGGPARYLAEASTRAEVAEAVAWADERNLPLIVIGGGSNIIWGDEGFPGLVLVNKITKFEAQALDADNIFVTVGGGENWDEVVARCVEQGFAGIELLSRIPGSAGAAPVQNIGAYGAQISDVLVTIEAFDREVKQFVTLRASECAFGYRSSRFKTTDKGRFIISAITLRLGRQPAQPPYYRDIQKHIEQHNITDVTPAVLRDIVTQIRKNKLPDPSVVPNAGSFFQNPIISREQYDELVAEHPEIEQTPPGWSQPPRWIQDDGTVKVAAGWLVEQSGFKAFEDTETGMATWPHQNLVLINKGAHTTADLLKFKQKIVNAVQAKYGITLTQEPEFVGT